MPCSVSGTWTYPFSALPREAMPALALILGSVNAVPIVLAANLPGGSDGVSSGAVVVAAASQGPTVESVGRDVLRESALPSDRPVTPGLVPERAPGSADPAEGGTGPVVAQAADPASAEAVSGAIVVMPSREATASTEKSLGSGFRFTVAPVRWNGNLAYNLSWTRADDAPSRLRNVQSGNLRGSTYLWQPWFAQLNGSVGFVTGTETSSGGDGNDAANRGRDTSLTGSLGLALFPASRFPFSASIERTDSRASGAFVGSDYTSTRISLRQDYTPLRAPFSFTGAFDRNVIDDTRVGRDTVDVIRGGVNWRGDRQSASLNASHIQNSGTAASRARFDIFNARHNWQPVPNLGVDSSANITRSETRSGVDTAAGVASRISTFDVGASAFWQPETENPLSLSAFGRLFRTTNDVGAVGSEAQSLTAGVSASYSPSTNLTLSGSGQITQVRTDLDSGAIGLLNAGIAYSGDPRKLGRFDYAWNTSATASLETGGADGNVTTVTLNAAHSLNRNLVTSERSTVTLSGFQNVGVVRTGAGGNSVSLGHSLSVAWNHKQSESFVTTLSASASDSRFFGDSEGSFQLLTAQLNGNMYISRYSSASAALSIQAVRQEVGQDSDGGNGGFTASVFGTLAYQHMRVLGVPQLRYSLLYSANTQELGARRQGNLAALPQGSTHSLEQRLDYRVGRLDLQALLRFSIVEGKNNSFLFLSVNREFGAL